MNEQEEAFAQFLRLLEQTGCLNYVVLIGSWAEFLYGRCGILPGFAPNIRTMDIDFLVRNLR